MIVLHREAMLHELFTHLDLDLISVVSCRVDTDIGMDMAYVN